MTFYDLGFLDAVEGLDPLCFPREANRPDYLIGYDDGVLCRSGKSAVQTGRVNKVFIAPHNLYNVCALKNRRNLVLSQKQAVDELFLF